MFWLHSGNPAAGVPFIPYAPYQQNGVVSPTVSRQQSERLPTVDEDEEQEELVDDNERVRLHSV